MTVKSEQVVNGFSRHSAMTTNVVSPLVPNLDLGSVRGAFSSDISERPCTLSRSEIQLAANPLNGFLGINVI